VVVDFRADLLNQRAELKTELHHLAGRGVEKTIAAEVYHSYQLGKSIALTNLYDLANLPHLTISIKLVARIKKY
jgi:hypothetical protein